MLRETEIMQQALTLAEENMRSGLWWPVACIIAKNKEIVFSSLNTMAQDAFDPTAHAEITTIRNFCKQQQMRTCSWYELYVTAEPCPMCLWAIYWTCFDAVYFASSVDDAEQCQRIDKKIYEQLWMAWAMRIIPCTQLLDSEWRALLQQRPAFVDKRPDLKELIALQRAQFSK